MLYKQTLGKIILRGSNIGIPNLLVTVFDANTSISQSSDELSLCSRERNWNRLGSLVTNTSGTFDLSVNDQKEEGNVPRRPHLVLMVSASEDNDGQSQNGSLATIVRRNAASVENFIIGLSEPELAVAKVPIPKDAQDVENVIRKRRLAAEREEKLRVESQRLSKEKLEARRKSELLVKPQFEKFLSKFSVVGENNRSLSGARYVARGASIAAANQDVFESAINSRINQASVSTFVSLSDDQAARFRDDQGRLNPSVPNPEIEVLFKSERSRDSHTFYKNVPPGLVCREGPVDPCVEVLEGKRSADDDHHEEQPTPEDAEARKEAPDAPIKEEEITLYIGKLVKDMTPPESTAIFKVQSRAGVQQVQKSVNGFTLESGPADTPALYDFHHIQIAFENVWHELFDDSMINVAKELYTNLVETGIDPNEYLVDVTNPKELIAYLKSLHKKTAPPDSPDPEEVIQEFDITPEQWGILTDNQRTVLKNIITQDPEPDSTIYGLRAAKKQELVTLNAVQSVLTPEQYQVIVNAINLYYDDPLRQALKRGQSMITYADYKLNSRERFQELHQVLGDLETSMSEPYQFSVFAADRISRSVNFGLVTTYRQEWVPKNYQVGELVKTVPLAPKEVRRFTKKTVIRKSRAEKEVENNLQARKTDSTETSRAESEIIQKAQKKTNFQGAAEGGINVGIANAKASSALSQDAAAESQEVKKQFREAVFKAAEEYKSERTTEVNVSTGEESSFEESGEISNPNDEIPVTYLFYQLQRRYQVSEKIHGITPVVLVAQEFPKPNEIDEDWIISHDWILRRVILDDSFIPALNYVSGTVVGDEFALEEMYQNIRQQRRIVDELKDDQVAIQQQVGRRYAALEGSIQDRIDSMLGRGGGAPLPLPVGFIFGGAPDVGEAMRAREDAAKDAYERAQREAKELQGRLEREITALNALTETYTKNLSEHLNRKAQIARLRVHIKSNIMYYMQAIWSHEPPDQRFFRLHQVPVPKLEGKMTYTFEDDPNGVPMPPSWKKPQKLVAKCTLNSKLEYQTLEEVADLDDLLGFKGNYMIFPLKKSNALTDFMTIPYLDPVFGVRDPDPLGNWTLTEFIEYVCCLRKKLFKEEFLKLLPGMMEAYRNLVNEGGADGNEIVVPTDSLFIEALPGVHPILEDFKLFHRVIDVKKAQADERAVELENIRFAARLLAGEHEDPTIEKKVVVEGGESVLVAPGDS
jgi:hypothetical protein